MSGKYDQYGVEAERLYVHGRTLEEIKTVTGVSVVTLSKWKNEFGWDEKRKKFRATGAGASLILEDAINQVLQRIMDEGVQPGMADEVAKLAKTLRELRRLDDIYAMTTIVMDKFVDYINQTYSADDETDRNAKEVIQVALAGFFKHIERSKA